MKMYLGIDPGVTGAYALLSDEGVIRLVSDFTSVAEVWKELDGLSDLISYAVIEDVHASPQMGVVSVFTFGKNAGAWQGLLTALKIPYALVTPAKWQKAIFDKKQKKGEKYSVEFCQRQFPHQSFKKSHNNRTDALCIALYARQFKRKLDGEQAVA